MTIKPMRVYGAAFFFCLCSLVAGIAHAEIKETYKRWEWFKDTYWIVPEEGIYSVLHSPGNTFGVVRGQTVFHITDYFNGYFTGSVVVKLSEARITTCNFVLGQVTPSGRVHMTMYDTDTGEVRNEPIGQMERIGKRQGEGKDRGSWTMVNQMTSPAMSGTLSHWAYMIQSKPGMASYDSLPFVDESIPDFMSACPEGPMIWRP